MSDDASRLRHELEAVSRSLEAVHKQIFETEGAYFPGRGGLAKDADLTLAEAAAAAGHVRALVFGLGEPRDEAFLNRYRPLLQASATREVSCWRPPPTPGRSTGTGSPSG